MKAEPGPDPVAEAAPPARPPVPAAEWTARPATVSPALAERTAEADEADDFAAEQAARPAESWGIPAPQAPLGSVRYDDDSQAFTIVETRSAPARRQWGVLATGAALSLGVVGFALLLLLGRPDLVEVEQQGAAAPPKVGSKSSEVWIDPAAPVDQRDRVHLSWTSNRDMDFVVRVTKEGVEQKPYYAGTGNSVFIEVEPGLRYCFRIQGTDAVDIYGSTVIPFRGAVCEE